MSQLLIAVLVLSAIPVIEGEPKVDQIGLANAEWVIQQRISDNEALVKLDVYGPVINPATGRFDTLLRVVGTHQMYCKGFDFSRSVDGGRFPYKGVIRVSGTHSYTTVAGSLRTVPLVVPSSEDEYQKLAERTAAAARAAADKIAVESEQLVKEWAVADSKRRFDLAWENRRVWRDRTGKFSVEAAYWEFKPGVVTLIKEDKTTINVPLTSLSEEDRKVAVQSARDRGDIAKRE